MKFFLLAPALFSWLILPLTLPTSAMLLSKMAIAQQIQPGIAPQTIEGRLEHNSQVLPQNGSYYNIYTFDGIAGETVIIEMSSSELDTYLIVLDANGNFIRQDDDGGGETNSRIVLTLPSSGTYQIYANSYMPRATGSYELSLQSRSGMPPYPIAVRPPTAPTSSVPPSPRVVEQEGIQLGQLLNADLLNDLPDSDNSDPFWMQRFITDSILGFEQEVIRVRQQLGDRHPQVATALHNLAALYMAQNREADAERAWLEALSIYRQQPDDNQVAMADTLVMLAAVAFRRGQYQEAEALNQEAIAIYQRYLAPENETIRNSLNQLADIYRAQGRDNEAASILTLLLDVDRNAEDPSDLILRLIRTGLIEQSQGNSDQAEAAYQEALDILQHMPNRENCSFLCSAILNNLALLYHAQGRYGEAESLYQQAIREQQSDDGIVDSVVQYSIPITYNLAELYRAQGNIPMAIATLQSGLDIDQQRLDASLANQSDAERQLDYVTSVVNAINHTVSLHLNAASNNADASQLSLTTILRRKGQVLDAHIRTLEILRQNPTPEILSLLAQTENLRRDIASLTVRQLDGSFSAQDQASLTELTSSLNQLEALLVRRGVSIGSELPPVELNTIANRIPQNGVLVEYIRYQPFDLATTSRAYGNLSNNLTLLFANNFGAPRYAAYLLFPDGRIEAVDLGLASEIDAAVESFRGLLQDRQANFQSRGDDATFVIEVNPERVENITSNIRALIYDPIAAYLGDREQLLISPDSQLNLLPFEALQTDDGRYLVEQYQINYLNSGRDLLRLGVVESSTAPAVIIANPDYDRAVGSENIGLREVSDDFSQFRVESLPGTAREAEALHSLMPNTEVLTGQLATEQTLKQVQSPGILHIATHGFFLENQAAPTPDNSLSTTSAVDFRIFPGVGVAVENPLLRSGLALAGFNQRSSGNDDGILTAMEAANLNLYGTQIVVLSACNTGLGDIENGEGVYGLRRAFAIAGAETQLISLWQVSDDGTERLMTRYYENLIAGMGRSESLRDVQLAMIRSGEVYSHPYYWAAFILTGDWRSLKF